MYKKQLYKFNSAKINNLALYIFLISFLITLPLNFFVAKKPLLVTSKVYFDIIMIIAIFIVGLALHEAIHALSAMIFGKVSIKDIKFGANLKQGMLYCHIKKPITASSYKIMLILPMIITGLIPLIISTFLGNIMLILIFCMLLSGGAGDIIMFFSLLKLDKNTLIMDNPYAPAYYAMYESDKLPANFVEVTKQDEEHLMEEMKQSPYASANGGKRSIMLKLLGILIFLALAVLIVFIIGIAMSFI